MKPKDATHLMIGPRLSLTFALLLALILGGNGILIWQFHIAREQTDEMSEASQEMNSVLRLQASVLSFQQRLSELAEVKDAQLLHSESERLQDGLFQQIRQTRTVLTHRSKGKNLDPSFSSALEAIELSISSQLHTLNALAGSGDWDAVRSRTADKQSVESKAATLVDSVEQDFTSEHSNSESGMRSLGNRILILVPAIAICTCCMAAFFGWTLVRRIVELRLEERMSERLRITQELHDTFLQTVQGCKLVVDDALDKSDDHGRMLTAMEQVAIWLGQASQEGRAALKSIRKSNDESYDFPATLHRALEEFRNGQMQVSLSVLGEAKSLQPIARNEVFRVALEAIRNACIHSACQQLNVILEYSSDLTLRVGDDGIGIDPAVVERGKDGHFGMMGMRDRVARIGGRMTVVSSPGTGTEIAITIPGRIVFTKT